MFYSLYIFLGRQLKPLPLYPGHSNKNASSTSFNIFLIAQCNDITPVVLLFNEYKKVHIHFNFMRSKKTKMNMNSFAQWQA
jgi:hypothetical protein